MGHRDVFDMIVADARCTDNTLARRALAAAIASGDGGDDGASGGEGTKRAPSKEEKALGEVRSTREFYEEALQKICWLGAGRIHGLQPLHH